MIGCRATGAMNKKDEWGSKSLFTRCQLHSQPSRYRVARITRIGALPSRYRSTRITRIGALLSCTLSKAALLSCTLSKAASLSCTFSKTYLYASQVTSPVMDATCWKKLLSVTLAGSASGRTLHRAPHLVASLHTVSDTAPHFWKMYLPKRENTEVKGVLEHYYHLGV